MEIRSSVVRLLLKALNPIWKIRGFGLYSEVLFWKLWARSRDSEVQRSQLLDPNLRFPEQLDPIVERMQSHVVRVLEVGAGPITNIGRRHPTKEIQLTPTDVLAKEYERLLAARGLIPPVPTVYADAEHLSRFFGPNTFDLVYAGNCLDHMSAPAKAIEEMVKVIRPGGWIVLLHRADEAQRQEYAGLHQWNLRADEGKFVLWTRTERIDVTDLLARSCSIRTTTLDDHVWVEITKH